MDYRAKARPNTEDPHCGSVRYLTNIPSELNNIIALYLNYTETIIIRNIYKIKVNYQYLLSENFPGFYQMFTDIGFDIYRNLKYRQVLWTYHCQI
jgi:hypothetical protein